VLYKTSRAAAHYGMQQWWEKVKACRQVSCLLSCSSYSATTTCACQPGCQADCLHLFLCNPPAAGCGQCSAGSGGQVGVRDVAVSMNRGMQGRGNMWGHSWYGTAAFPAKRGEAWEQRRPLASIQDGWAHPTIPSPPPSCSPTRGIPCPSHKPCCSSWSTSRAAQEKGESGAVGRIASQQVQAPAAKV